MTGTCLQTFFGNKYAGVGIAARTLTWDTTGQSLQAADKIETTVFRNCFVAGPV